MSSEDAKRNSINVKEFQYTFVHYLLESRFVGQLNRRQEMF